MDVVLIYNSIQSHRGRPLSSHNHSQEDKNLPILSSPFTVTLFLFSLTSFFVCFLQLFTERQAHLGTLQEKLSLTCFACFTPEIKLLCTTNFISFLCAIRYQGLVEGLEVELIIELKQAMHASKLARIQQLIGRS